MNRPGSLPRLTVALAALLAMAGAQAQTFSAPVYSGAKDDIRTVYKAERSKCDTLAGNAKDICSEQTKANEKVALAQLEYNQSGSAKHATDLREARFDGAFEVAKERCDDLAGNPKDVCLQAAKSAHEKAKADLKMDKKVTEAADEAAASRMQADYKLASERCDALAGDKKSVCMASAKARFAQR
ncbi:MAG: hypothetical protein H7Z15_08350 [Rhizobacter sp.]|nr:hypothetical protein [Rhizobacter sp.]